jgi:hypothetical protein
MGRYVIILIAPLIISIFIAAGVVVVVKALWQRTIDNEIRRRRIEARRTLLEARRQDSALSAADPPVSEQSSHPTQEWMAS